MERLNKDTKSIKFPNNTRVQFYSRKQLYTATILHRVDTVELFSLILLKSELK